MTSYATHANMEFWEISSQNHLLWSPDLSIIEVVALLGRKIKANPA